MQTTSQEETRYQEVPEGGGGAGSDPISQCYFMKIKDFFKIPTRISNVVYNNKPMK